MLQSLRILTMDLYNNLTLHSAVDDKATFMVCSVMFN